MEPLGLDKWHCKFIMMSIVSKWLFLHWSTWNSIVRRKTLNYTFITFLSDARMYDSNKISGILSKWRPSSRRTSLGGRTTGWSWRTSPSRRSAWGSPSPPAWPAPAASGATWSGGMTWTTRRSQHAWVRIHSRCLWCIMLTILSTFFECSHNDILIAKNLQGKNTMKDWRFYFPKDILFHTQHL